MSRVIRAVVGVALIVAGVVTGNFQLILAGVTLVGGALLQPSGSRNRAAAAAQLQLGEQPRQAVLGRSAVAGTLVDAFNYGGKYSTDWEVLVIALADHRCDALEGFFVDDTYVAFAGDGNVAGFNNQLQVFWRSGTWDQTVPSILTTNGPGWTANDRGRGVAYAVVAYKSDASDAKNPVWPSGRPRFRWVVRGLRCYQARKDTTVGGSGAHRRDNPATWEWTENVIDIRYNWVRGIYAGDRVTEPGMLLIGRGLSAIEAPPANVFARANLCDEIVGGQARYRIGGVVASTEPFIDVESDFAAACAGVISQPEGAVEVDPGEAKAPVASFTDADLLVGSDVRWNEGILGQQDEGWVNTVAARFVDPAQRWNVRSAPVRRDLADVVADGAPREQQPQLDFVTNAPQAQRIAEVIRRLGRLWGRAQVTLPPRFAFVEEGDWVTWQSDRRFGGATLTFRVEAWGSDKAWHHRLTLRQISASVYSDTAPLDDGSIASTQAPPPVVAAPGVGVWNAAAVLLGSGSVRVPALRVAGLSDDPAADFVVFEYVQQVAAPGVATIWTFAATSRPDVTLFDIPVPEGGTFWVAVSYIVDGIQGERRVIGPLATNGLSYGDGSPVAPVAPGNANRVPFTRFEGGPAYGWFGNSPVSLSVSGGRYSIISDPVFGAAGVSAFLFTSPGFPVVPGERLSVASSLRAAQITGPNPSFWQFYIEYRDASNAIIGSDTIVSGTGGEPETNRREGFSVVPANAARALLVLQVTSAGAGTVRMAFVEPMVASAAADQTVHPPYSPGPNAVDGALPNSLITVGGDGLLNGIGTTGINVDNGKVPLGFNSVVNSEFTRGKFGWNWAGGGFEADWGVNLPTWFGHRNVMWATVPGPSAFSSERDLAPDTIWNGAPLANAPLLALPIVAGDTVLAAVQAAPHRCTFQLFLLMFDAAGTLISAPVIAGGTPGGAANGDLANFTRISISGVAPANARWAIPMMRLVGTGEVNPFIFFTEPMITKIATGQTAVPGYIQGRADGNADVTVTLGGPTSDILSYTSTGTLDPSDQLPRTYVYTLSNRSGLLTSGITWNYRIIEGMVNGFAASATLRSMSAISGAGQFALSDLGSNTAQVEIIGNFGGGSVSGFLQLTKAFAPPNTTGGGGGGPASASQSSGFSPVNSSSFVTVSNELQVTSTGTTQTGTVNLTFNPPNTTESASTIEVQLERWDGSTWVSFGAAVTASSEVTFDEELSRYVRLPAVFNFSRTATVTASTNQRIRVRARRSSGTISHSTAGTLTLSA